MAKNWYFAHVLRAAGMDCSCGGPTSRYDMLYLLDEDWTQEEAREFCEKRHCKEEEVLQIERWSNGFYSFIRAKVMFPKDRHEGDYCASGNYITGDSRFSEEVNQYPITVLDRFDDWETIHALSI